MWGRLDLKAMWGRLDLKAMWDQQDHPGDRLGLKAM
jgi:hypothetical protein